MLVAVERKGHPIHHLGLLLLLLLLLLLHYLDLLALLNPHHRLH
jgi:hypothetical protein